MIFAEMLAWKNYLPSVVGAVMVPSIRKSFTFWVTLHLMDLIMA